MKTDLFKAKVESSSLNPLVTAEFENNRKAVDEAVNLAPDSSITVNPVETVPEVQPVVAPVEAKIYGIITGSFKSEENARTHIEDLKAEGFDPEMVQAANGFFRVMCHVLQRSGNSSSQKGQHLSKKFPGTWISKTLTYFIILPLLTFSAGETITSFPSLSSAIRIIPFDSIPFIFLGSRFATIEICFPIIVLRFIIFCNT